MTTTDEVLLSAVILVDRRGWILLQLRDESAANFPNVWGLPGGHVEPGEDVADAAVRELFEETALAADGPLVHYRVTRSPERPSRVKHFFYGTTDARQEDVVLGEGAAMVFTPPTEVLDGRPYTPTTAATLQDFLASPIYAGLVAGATTSER